MRDYARLSGTFFQRGTGRRIRGDKPTQLLALYLIGAPSGTMCGVFHTGLPTVESETGLSRGEVEHGLVRLGAEGFCYYDHEDETMYVVKGVVHQLGLSLRANKEGRPDNRAIGLRRELRLVGPHPFVADFWRRYETSHLLGPWPFPVPREMPWPGLPLVESTRVAPVSPAPAPPPAATPKPAPKSVPIELTEEGRQIFAALGLHPSLAGVATERMARAMAEHRVKLKIGGKVIPPIAHVIGAIANLAVDATSADWNAEVLGRKLRTYIERANATDVGDRGKTNGHAKNGKPAPVAQHDASADEAPWNFRPEDPRSVEAARRHYGPGTAKAREYEQRHETAKAEAATS